MLYRGSDNARLTSVDFREAFAGTKYASADFITRAIAASNYK